MNEDPLIIALYCAIALYIGYIYRADIKALAQGFPILRLCRELCLSPPC